MRKPIPLLVEMFKLPDLLDREDAGRVQLVLLGDLQVQLGLHVGRFRGPAQLAEDFHVEAFASGGRSSS